MDKQYTSNIINDEDLARRFSSEAFIAARNLRSKYFSLFEFMTEDDIVMECWDKILRQDIGFDTTRNCKFESFVRMMVNNRCIDMCRKIQKHEDNLSLDAKYTTEKNDMTTLADYIPDTYSYDDILYVEVMDVIDSMDSEFETLPVRDVMELFIKGYKPKDMVQDYNIKSSDVKIIKNRLLHVFKRRCNGTCKTLGDILYGDEETLMDMKDEILAILSFIRDAKSGIFLSDIVKRVIDGYSYDQIGEELGVGGMRIKGFLDRYSMMLI